MTPERADRSVAFTVVHLKADGAASMRSAEVLMTWMADRPDINLHTVLWLPGWSSTARFEAAGTFHDVAHDHRRTVPRALRRVGADQLASRLTARAIRSTLRSIPASGAVYLNGAACAPALRYLPPGERRVITHLHAADREVAPSIPPEHLARLIEATDVWFADFAGTRDWAAATWGIDPAAVDLVGPLVDPEAWGARQAPADTDRLYLAVAGATWFRTDHAARLVQTLLRLRPDLDFQLLWTEVDREEHLAPLLHDLDLLGVRDRLHVPASEADLQDRLREVSAIVLTTPDKAPPWQGGLPVVCFDSHPHAPEVGRSPHGQVVEYLDLVGMANAVLELHDEVRAGVVHHADDGRTALAHRDVNVVGERLVGLARGDER